MRLIDADALLDEAQSGGWDADINELRMILKYVPTIDAVPVVRGEWIDSPTGDYAICSHCHVEWNVFDNDTYRFQHCPACGAKMEDKPCG